MFLIKFCALSLFAAYISATQYAHNPFLLGGLLQTTASPNQPQTNQWNTASVSEEKLSQQQPEYNQQPIAASPGQFLYHRPTIYSPTQANHQTPIENLQVNPVPPMGSAIGATGIPSSLPATELNKKCLQPTGLFLGSTCNKFVSCLNGVATEQPCPEGLHFSARGLYCDRPENVECGDTTPTSTVVLHQAVTTQEPVVINPVVYTTQVPTFVAEGSNRCLRARGQFSTSACNTFLNCWDGVALEQSCPEGLLFNSKGYCDYFGNVNCEGRSLPGLSPAYAIHAEARPSTVSSVPGQSSPAPTTAAANPTTLSPPTSITIPTADPALRSKCLKPRGQFPSNSCSKFVNCWDGVILEQECPQGFLFSTKGYCDFPHNVYCGTRSVSNEALETKSQCPLENGTFRDKNKCNSYYTCSFNEIVARYDCPEGFNYNDVIGVCDYDYRVDCSQEPLVFPARSKPVHELNKDIPDINVFAHSNKETAQQYDCPVEFGTFRDAQNCSTYYTCVSRKIVAKYVCPEGFSFNDDIGVCDYAERVDCTKPPKIYQVQQNVLPQIPANLQEKIDKCTPGTVFRLNPQCTSVCLCRDGMAEIVQCPAGLAYDSNMDKCILPHLAKC